MTRIDLHSTIDSFDFSDEIWEWIDLLGEIVVITQKESMHQEKSFVAETPYEKYFLYATNKDLSTFYTIYILLRWEQIHQASSHIRLLCEGLITLKYMSLDPETRANLFWGYSDIETYKIATTLLEWEKEKANPIHVKGFESALESIRDKYEKAQPSYTFTTKNGKEKLYRNWCNKDLAGQAVECGEDFERLYDLVYRKLSSYIHGSAWSLRRQLALSRAHYDADIVLTDFATIVRSALAVWMDWAKFLVREFDWRLVGTIEELPARIETLDAKHFPHT